MRGRCSPALTVGVEEEFLLVDPVSRSTVPAADHVLLKAAERMPIADGAELHPELQSTQVEASTGICTDLDALKAHILNGRLRLAAAAQEIGVWLVSTGTPVLTDRDIPPVENKRFHAISDRYLAVVSSYQACACHVHVGIDDPDLAVAVINHLRPWLPTLLALSGNSPFDRGRDSGYESWRAMEMARFPAAGVPPWFGSAHACRRHVERMVDCGVLVDDRMTFWLARPSRRWPTVEVRAADAAATADEAVLQAALTRALIDAALGELELGREAPPVDASLCAAAVWSAARYGLEGQAVHPLQERAMPATKLLAELLQLVSPALEETGDLPRVKGLLGSVRAAGSGSSRQRRWALDGPQAVVDGLATQTLQEHLGGCPPSDERRP